MTAWGPPPLLLPSQVFQNFQQRLQQAIGDRASSPMGSKTPENSNCKGLTIWRKSRQEIAHGTIGSMFPPTCVRWTLKALYMPRNPAKPMAGNSEPMAGKPEPMAGISEPRVGYVTPCWRTPVADYSRMNGQKASRASVQYRQSGNRTVGRRCHKASAIRRV